VDLGRVIRLSSRRGQKKKDGKKENTERGEKFVTTGLDRCERKIRSYI